LTRERDHLLPGIRSLHLRHARNGTPSERIKAPPHILYYRVVDPGLVEIVRVLHERMEPGRHLGRRGW
jgi:toxin ParE1/3/4